MFSILQCSCLAMQLGHSHLSFPLTAHTLPTECCTRYAQKIVRHVKSFYKMPQACSLPAVVIVAATGDEVCADPKKLWVKRAIEELQRKK
ncbi:CCL3 protein, partial [Eolophus roseicapillus]|nr:CCL3 protein [Eolophus roseicapilla]